MKMLSFLEQDEQKKFNSNFFTRKIQREDTGKIITVEIGNLYMQAEDRDHNVIRKREVNLIKDFFSKNTSLGGFWINGRKGDGISWLAENMKLYSENNKKAYSAEIIILKEDKEINSSNIPLISNVFENKKTFINCSIKSKLIKKSYLKNSAIFGLIITGLPSFVDIFIKNSIPSVLFYIILIFFILCLILIGYNYFKERSNNNIQKVIEVIEDKEFVNDPRYKTLIKLIAEKMNRPRIPRIIIIDDFSKLDPITKDVLKCYCEIKNNNFFNESKDFWIIFSTNIADSEYVKNNWIGIDKFQIGTLLPLRTKEKKEFAKRIGVKDDSNYFETIKDICSKGQNSISKEEVKKKLEKFKNDNPEIFKFLYLIVSNAFPADIEISQKEIIKKIKTSANAIDKEKDKYLPYIFSLNNEFSEKKLIEYFIQIKQFLSYIDDNKFNVKYEIWKSIEENYKSPAELFHFNNGYWAMCWYFTYGKNRWKTNWTQKLAYHLVESWEIDHDDILKEHLFDAHLLTIDKCIKYFLPNETNKLIESSYQLNIQQFDNREAKIQQLVLFVVDAYLYFNFKIEKNRIKNLGYGDFYNLITNDDIKNANILQLDKYQFLSDKIVYILIERYWELVLFLHVSHKRFSDMKYSINTKQKLFTIINSYFTSDYLQNINKEETQKVQNIALWIWIKTFELFHTDINIDDFDTTKKDIDNIHSLIESFVIFSEQHIYYRSNIDTTLTYTIMQDAAYISIASGILVNKKMKDLKMKEYSRSIIRLYKLKLNIDNDNDEKKIDDLMRLMLIQSLVWKNGDYTNRYYTLSIIRTQLYCCWNNNSTNLDKFKINRVKYSIEDEKKYLFKDELGVVTPTYPLYTLANFTLCNLYSDYGTEISSFYFQQSLFFLKNIQISQIQAEYVFMGLIAYWNYKSKVISDGLLSLSIDSNLSKNDLIYYISQDVDTSFCHLINTISHRKDKNINRFFKNLFEEISEKNVSNVEIAEALWRNFEFEEATVEEKLMLKNEYEIYWKGKENLFPYSSGLENLLLLDNSSDSIKNKTFDFLTDDNLDFDIYSGHLSLAQLYLHICYNENNKKPTPHYHKILEIVVKQIELTKYINELELVDDIYNILYVCTGEVKYNDALIVIKYKLSQKIFEEKIMISTFEFFCNLCRVWGSNLICYDTISSNEYYETLKQDFASKKSFLKKYTKAPDVTININELNFINSEFILINDILEDFRNHSYSISHEFQYIIEECEKSAKQKMGDLINLIIHTNQHYTDHILKLKKQWEEQLIVEDEND